MAKYPRYPSLVELSQEEIAAKMAARHRNTSMVEDEGEFESLQEIDLEIVRLLQARDGWTREEDVPFMGLTMLFVKQDIPHAQAGRIVRLYLEEFLDLFLRKTRDYGETAHDLGAAGQYSELHRKMGLLRRVLWNGEEIQEDSIKRVLLDMIGHCFLAIDYVENTNLTKYPKGSADATAAGK